MVAGGTAQMKGGEIELFGGGMFSGTFMTLAGSGMG